MHLYPWLAAALATGLLAGCAVGGPTVQGRPTDVASVGTTSPSAGAATSTSAVAPSTSEPPTATPPVPTATATPAPTATAVPPTATATPDVAAAATARSAATKAADEARAVERLGAGNTLLGAGNLDGALHEYATAQALAPDRPDVRSAMGTAQARASATAGGTRQQPAGQGGAAALTLPPVLPGSLLPSHRIVAYYGNPLVGAMGILGQLPEAQLLDRLHAQASAYAQVDPQTPVQPALELIATVAQAGAGKDGLYRLRMDDALIENVARMAQSRNDLLILDVQIGRSSVQSEVQAMAPYLKRANVHLALDPEFAMGPNEVPGKVFGSLDAGEINLAIRTLADVVEQNHLPPKVLIIHRFIEEMLTNYRQIKLDSRVQVVIDMDGFGSPDAKISKYNAYVRDQPVEYSAIKLFYTQDYPVMSPADVLALRPVPNVVIYQ